MNSRDRVRLALDHKEPDRVPFDLGGTHLTTIHVTAYHNLRQHVGLPAIEPSIISVHNQLAMVDEDLAERLETDVRLVLPGEPSGFEFRLVDDGAYEAFTDEWGVSRRKPKEGGLYYAVYKNPLANADSLAELKAYRFPDPLDDQRFATLRTQAEAAASKGKAVALTSPWAGILEVYARLRGYEEFYVDLATNHEYVAYMLDRLVEFKSAFWERALQLVGDLADVVIEADDLAGQDALLMSPQTYRTLVKPRHQRLFSYLKALAPVKVFFHSDGAVRPLIGDLIEAGIDILNPLQRGSAGMDLRELKREFGRDLVFWGGGVDTQGVLCAGTPAEVKADVRQSIEALAPGGGFVFAAVHDIQADVPPQNVMAMWEAWKDSGSYR